MTYTNYIKYHEPENFYFYKNLPDDSVKLFVPENYSFSSLFNVIGFFDNNPCSKLPGSF